MLVNKIFCVLFLLTLEIGFLLIHFHVLQAHVRRVCLWEFSDISEESVPSGSLAGGYRCASSPFSQQS